MMTYPRGVLVVGAGPTGLTAALGLATRGIAVRVVDHDDPGAHHSRAAVVHPATLESLAPLGVTDQLLDLAVRVPYFQVRSGRRRLTTVSFATLDTPYPFTAMVPQSDTEAVLRRRLATLGVEVEWHTGLVDLRQSHDWVTASLDRSGAGEEVEADLVVGADGGHSRVRDLVGVPFDGSRYDASFVLADVEMAWPVGPESVSLTFAPQGLAVVAPLPLGRWRVVATATHAPERPSGRFVQDLLRERTGEALVHRVHDSGRFRVAHRLARRYRVGRVLLAGDAAHVHSPAGGQGMNTGIRDAICLAQVIAVGDLDRYEAQRKPVARRVIALTDRMTRAATQRHAPVRFVRDELVAATRYVPAVQKAVARELAGLNDPVRASVTRLVS